MVWSRDRQANSVILIAILGLFAIIHIIYFYLPKKKIVDIQICQNINGESNCFFFLNQKKIEQYHRLNLLMNYPLFTNRSKNIKFMRNEYNNMKRNSEYSLVLSTYERVECFERVIKHLIAFRPNNTEIIISDDSSQNSTKIELLQKVADKYLNEDIYVITHTRNFGSFHTKLDGFLFSVGDFIMSIDDDDIFDDFYYIELASKTSEVTSKTKDINFIIPMKFPYMTDYIGLPYSIKDFVYSFHNHYAYSFRRSLLENVDFPPHSVYILRDDAPLTIPLYAQTKFSQIFYYENQYCYRVDRKFYVSHQSMYISKNSERVLNGYHFIIQYLKKIHREDLLNNVRAAYL